MIKSTMSTVIVDYLCLIYLQFKDRHFFKYIANNGIKNFHENTDNMLRASQLLGPQAFQFFFVKSLMGQLFTGTCSLHPLSHLQ